jgi:PadR family transcriptional regulator, regulatory protein PadR
LTQPKADLLQGTLDLLILKALSLGSLHGYVIIQRLRQLSDELLEVEQALSTRRSTGSSSEVG